MSTKRQTIEAAAKDSHRSSSRAYARKMQRAIAEIEIPRIANARRRRKGLRDIEYFLRTYMEHIFFNPFTDDHRDIIRGIHDAVMYRAKQSVAAARGDGKSSLIRGVAGVHGIAKGLIRFLVLVNATKEDGKNRLTDIRYEFEHNDLLAADFPEICTPIRALEGATQRQRTQTVLGNPTLMEWGKGGVIFPTVKGSKASGAVIRVFGAESAIQGQVCRELRPDLAVLDDIETPESARNPAEVAKRRDLIDRSVLGLAGPNRRIGVCYPCTIICADCLADEFTDPRRRPAWNGIRHKLIVRMPDSMDMWETYMAMRREQMIKAALGQEGGDRLARGAHEYYLANRAAMDAGAKIGNPYRFDTTELEDGSTLQVSTLQFAFDFIADGADDGGDGWRAFRAEYQNEPPDEELRHSDTPEAPEIMEKVNGKPRGVVPEGTTKLTGHVDVHGRHLDWVIVAWRDTCGFVVDYGVSRVNSPDGSMKDPANVPHVEKAIYDALGEWRDWATENGWPMEGTGEIRRLDMCLVDAGWKDKPVYAFCEGDRCYFPARGFGSGMGQAKYREPRKPGKNVRIGAHWFASRPRPRRWVYNTDADYFKQFVQSAFRVPVGGAGSLSLFGQEPIKHRDYARQMCSEEWVTEYKTGKGMISFWDKKARDNHWLDATAGACAAAAICGVGLLQSKRPAPRRPRGVAYIERFSR